MTLDQLKEIMNKRTISREKNAATKLEMIEKKYGKDFGLRSDQKLFYYLNEKGYSSLAKLLTTNVQKFGG